MKNKRFNNPVLQGHQRQIKPSANHTVHLAMLLVMVCSIFCGCGAKPENDVAATTAPSIQETVHVHNYVDKVIDPTCTEKGYTEHKCTECGHSYRNTFVDATGHNFGKWEVIKEATSEEEGQQERVCTDCGKTEIQGIAMLENELSEPTKSTVPPETEPVPLVTEPSPTTPPTPSVTEPEPTVSPTPPVTESEVPFINNYSNPLGWDIYECMAYALFVTDVRSWGGDDLHVTLVDDGVWFQYTNQSGEMVEHTVISENDQGYAVSVFIEEDGTITYERNRDFN